MTHSAAALRLAGSDDAETIAALATQVFLDTYAADGVRPDLAAEAFHEYSNEAFARRLDEPDRRFVLAERGDALVGFAEVRLSPRAAPGDVASGAELVRLYVQPRSQRGGVGRALLARVEELVLAGGVDTVWLTAWEGNANALAFYRKFGCADVGSTTYEFQGRTYGNRVLVKRFSGPPSGGERASDESRCTLRPEEPADREAVTRVIDAAFRGRPYSEGDEAQLVEALRRAGALTVSLVAERDGEVVGQVAASPAAAADGSAGWYGLGPVAVLPAHQRRGIGSQLVRAALQSLVQRGAQGCILVGDPAYYSRFEFALAPANTPEGQPAEYFQVRLLGAKCAPPGPFAFHPAFGPAH